MPRRPPRVLVAVSAIMLAGVVALWACSYGPRVRRIWSWTDAGGDAPVIRAILFQLRPGGFSLAYDRTTALAPAAAPRIADRGWNDHRDWRPPPATFDTDYLLGVWGDAAPTASVGLPAYRWRHRDAELAEDQWGVAVERRFLALVALAAATPLGLRAISRWRTTQRIASGHCGRCGYDLTANASGRCPECGAEVPPVAAEGRA